MNAFEVCIVYLLNKLNIVASGLPMFFPQEGMQQIKKSKVYIFYLLHKQKRSRPHL